MSNSLRPVFARNTTGLVRQISPLDAFLFNQSFINTGLILLLTLVFVPAFHPSANIRLAAVAGALLALPTAVVHGAMAATFPRSGGDYVYNSRLLHPVLGFAGNWNITVWLLIYVGFGAYAFAQYGLAPLFRYIELHGITGAVVASRWVGTPKGTFIVGTLALAIVTLTYILGTRIVARMQRWLFLFGLVSVLLMIAALFSSSSQEFASRFNGYASQAFGVDSAAQYLLTKATTLGLQSGIGFSFVSTCIAFYYIANWFFWGNASTYLGGEVQRAERTQLITMPLAVLATLALVLICFVGFERTVTSPLLAALGYVMTISPQESLPVFYSELAAISSPHAWIGLLILTGSLYWPLAFVLAPIGPATRNILAWSLDRLVPERLCALHPRFHTPVGAIIVCATVAEIGLALFSFVPAFSAMVGIVGAFVTYLLTSVAAIVLSFRTGRIEAIRPLTIRKHYLAVAGVLSVVAIVLCDISVLSDPYSGISLSPAADAGRGKGMPFMMLLVNVGIFLSGFLIYYVAAAIQRARGVDVSLAFAQMPPE